MRASTASIVSLSRISIADGSSRVGELDEEKQAEILEEMEAAKAAGEGRGSYNYGGSLLSAEQINLVPVHDLGIDDDQQLYFTMRLVRGRDFEHVIDLGARLGKQVVLNLAPARPLGDESLARLGGLAVNETEAEFLTGRPVKTDADVESGPVRGRQKSRSRSTAIISPTCRRRPSGPICTPSATCRSIATIPRSPAPATRASRTRLSTRVWTIVPFASSASS